jgi:hypothetical protein
MYVRGYLQGSENGRVVTIVSYSYISTSSCWHCIHNYKQSLMVVTGIDYNVECLFQVYNLFLPGFLKVSE